MSWLQPPFTSGTPEEPAPGLHQFDNIVVTPIPEPSMLLTAATGVLLGLGYCWRRKRAV